MPVLSAKALRLVRLATVLCAGASLAACASVQPKYATNQTGGAGAPRPSGQGVYKVGKPYQINGVWYYPSEQPNYNETGVASWYGDAFHLKATANGELFDMNAFTAAHKTLPLPSIVEVTNLDNGKKMKVRVNDRGPFVGDRIIDMSYAAAQELGFDRKGLARVRVKYVGPAPVGGPDPFLTYAKADAQRRYQPAPLNVTPAAPPAAAPAPYRNDSFQVASAAPVTASKPVPLDAAVATSLKAQVPEYRRPSSHAPLTGEALPDIRPTARAEGPVAPSSQPDVYAPAPAAVASSGSDSGFRIQAGAFAERANAERAVAQLSGAGEAVIESLALRDGGSLWRVVLPGPADEAEAYALRDRVAEIGFADARVVRAF
ncbi:septal ring lytic transglycosylase RlpA family protein [Phenylobacterium deserti]|uniref:Endolytic peptidoglycan transglycosylase RlpA n=1 Tax=Phenylobacterium deserti TaxID=1914756 RepID=A0A328ABH7_9CAUL|nr:septal ring lytic transglycosylase RlpA family protein [Phenylobacterium deserti]RAK52153.1 septal ring lytic transglycosylase RlpA family protein [Phenylobacterium deserti]